MRLNDLLMNPLNSRHIDFLLPNFSVRKALTPEASASLNTGENTSNPISFRSRSFGKSKWCRV